MRASRTSFSAYDKRMLKEAFAVDKYLSAQRSIELAIQLDKKESALKNWFRNQRELDQGSKLELHSTREKRKPTKFRLTAVITVGRKWFILRFTRRHTGNTLRRHKTFLQFRSISTCRIR